MSHIEIAKLAGKRPDTVKKSMERLQDKGLISFTPMTESCLKTNRAINAYHVNQRDSYVVMAQVSPEFTAKLVDRWQDKGLIQLTPMTEVHRRYFLHSNLG
ncbi:Rha family transcriptional regulator [Endozoicomonas sp. ISHI1]|uniref:Rha family transcriptional regulator n=1 Tax=Endozoicomonas sp. ISHI1 TaxID=2825882 RepID=UPI0021490923|nr:Rha family transcriptional regulator [Endozoicomonas sp. ISHI1]